ncbi:MAG: thiamine-monophosphate kinase [Phycisphaeraceae bacterium]|nr:MAG: thiamine-monophosphate kinase [Phycisphaeraceae bacterium]
MHQPPRESELLAHIRDRSTDLHGLAGAFGEIVVGPGDDCAVIREPGGGLLLIGVDQLVEGRHYQSGTDLDLIARKAIARAVSDIAAMGGRPCWGLATGVLPASFSRGDELFDAMAKWARHWACPLIGGDIASGPAGSPLSLTVTVAGRMEGGAPLLRSGALEGDVIWLTGQIGGSFESGWHLRFEPRIDAGLAAATSGRVHAAIDLSDGLGRDAARVGVASGVRLEIEATRLPISHRSKDWLTAVSEGEDYELLLAARPRHPEVDEPPFAADPPLIGPIGCVRACREGEAPGATIVDPHGVEHDAERLGWDHGG